MKIVLFMLFLFLADSGAFAQKYVPSEPPPQMLKLGEIYHFERQKDRMKVSLDLVMKAVMFVRYTFRIEYPDKRVVTKKGIAHMRKEYDLGAEEREKDGDCYSCQPFSPKNTREGEYLEICVSYEEDDKNGKKLVSFSYVRKGYPKIVMLNIGEK